MDPLDFLEPAELLTFFHCRKTEMSCMENPLIFLNQLRDHNLIPEDKYKITIRMKSKDKIRRAVYEILDCLEKENSEHIPLFWRCVFKDVIMNQYPTLKLLHNSLMDGSFHFDPKLPERRESEESDERGSSKVSDGEEKETKSAKKKRKHRSGSSEGDDEQSGSSAKQTPSQKKKVKKIHFSSPRKGEAGEIWTWPIYKTQLPVTCGEVEGTLIRDKLARGEKCILVDKKQFTPSEFEKLAGKGSAKNWKLSIRCKDTPLGKLIKDGHLKAAVYKRRIKQARKSLFAASHSNTDEEDSEDEEEAQSLTEETSGEETEEQGESTQVNLDHCKTKFKVTCGALTGTLYKFRFASGKCGKSIRTELSWMSPEEFVNTALNQRDAAWRKDILYEGEPLSALIEANVLILHSLLCKCKRCKPKDEDLDDEKNDDECCICKSDGEEDLVECDQCPRSFHQNCHLPHIDDTTVEDDNQWLCTFCVFKLTEECRYPDEQRTEAVMSRQISQHLLECQYLLLYLCNADEEQIFATNPRQYLENYCSVIKTPMWLDKIADRLQRNEYQTVGEFVSDVQLIFTNSATYNRNPQYLNMGEHLKHLFDREFKKAFNIQD
ncbi:nuclear body protein SP140-like isoform X2 [Poecilia latipinna]|uniref:nuclear body protein SP140-like isoform X2 n=1 Tax=Poecilia latipinna TaxID=48699 RepID=UPI00072E35B6|nr:PREDICTED: nuclear body protein SP140-like isoform X2 [Poecilia latipinna]XP_016533887.1 PREDICTED: nuclear body protein SP140-like isoform X2 [Poecilia formosa]